VKRLFFLIVAASVMAACADSPTAVGSQQKALTPKAQHDDGLACRSGYIIAYDENGNPYCVPE
jgi:hypothetical protein